jgi:hypothetical protein
MAQVVAEHALLVLGQGAVEEVQAKIHELLAVEQRSPSVSRSFRIGSEPRSGAAPGRLCIRNLPRPAR